MHIHTYCAGVALEEDGAIVATVLVASGESTAQRADILLVDGLILQGLSGQIGQFFVGRGNASLIRAGEGGGNLIQHRQIEGKALRGHIRGYRHVEGSIRIHQILVQGTLQLTLHRAGLGLQSNNRINISLHSRGISLSLSLGLGHYLDIEGRAGQDHDHCTEKEFHGEALSGWR